MFLQLLFRHNQNLFSRVLLFLLPFFKVLSNDFDRWQLKRLNRFRDLSQQQFSNLEFLNFFFYFSQVFDRYIFFFYLFVLHTEEGIAHEGSHILWSFVQCSDCQSLNSVGQMGINILFILFLLLNTFLNFLLPKLIFIHLSNFF